MSLEKLFSKSVDRRRFLTMGAAFSVLAALAPNAFGQEGQPRQTSLPPKADEQLDTRAAWEKAQDYSLEHTDMVAFSVHGRTKGNTSEEIGQKIQAVLTTHGIQSYFYTDNENHIGAGLNFYIEGLQYGPVGLTKAVPTILEVAHDFKEAHPQTASVKPTAFTPE